MKQNKVFQFLIHLKAVFYVALVLIIIFLISLVSQFFPANACQNPVANTLISMRDKIVIGVVVMPIIETLIFQTSIVSFVVYLIKRPKYNFYTALLVSSTVFALSHPYNIFYIIVTFLGGIALAFTYYMARYKRINATVATFLVHAIWNLFGFLTS